MTTNKFLTSTPQTTPTSLNKAWEAAAGKKETAVRLKRLPPGVTFVDEPIHYDEARGLLLYRGFMFHPSYLYLHKLAIDAEYQAAIDQLYLGSAVEPSQRKYSSLVKLAASLLVAVAALGVWFYLR